MNTPNDIMMPTLQPTMMPDVQTTMQPMMHDVQTTMQSMMPHVQTTMMPTIPDVQTTMMPTMQPQPVGSYEIKRWDVILSPNGLNKQPMIFIYPDINFINLINNNEVLHVQIQNTNTVYDGQVLYGTVSRSSFIPNFFSKTQLYVVILDCEWYGYPNPSTLGTATFSSPV